MKKILIKTLIGISFINNLNLYAQKKDYIVKQNNDTIYVQKVKLKYDEIKVKENGERIKYSFDEIKSFYISSKNECYVRIKSPIPEYLDSSRDNIFLERMTDIGKVNLYKYSKYINTGLSVNGTTVGNKVFSTYIGIDNSRPELIELDSFFGNKLEYEAYTILRLYLNENKEILSKLDSLYQSKHKGMIKRIVEIINEYNKWLELRK